jgi:hypothetical protein
VAIVRRVSVEFLTDEQAAAYGRFVEEPTRPELERFFWQIQPVEAFASISSVNSSEGFFQFSILRGRSLMSHATIAR